MSNPPSRVCSNFHSVRPPSDTVSSSSDVRVRGSDTLPGSSEVQCPRVGHAFFLVQIYFWVGHNVSKSVIEGYLHGGLRRIKLTHL